MEVEREIDRNRKLFDFLEDVRKVKMSITILDRVPLQHHDIFFDLLAMKKSGALTKVEFPRSAMARCLTRLTGTKVTHQSLARYLGDEPDER